MGKFQPVSELDLNFNNDRFEGLTQFKNIITKFWISGSTQNIDIMAVMKNMLQLLGPDCGEIFIIGSQTFYLPPKSGKGKEQVSS